MNDKVFIGRETELSIINEIIESKHDKAMLIYGPRRVGKSALIEKAMSTYPEDITISFECVKGSLSYNMRLFAREIARATDKHFYEGLSDIFDIFSALENEISNNRRVIVALDEYPYLRQTEGEGVIDSYLQKIIDHLPSGFKIVLSGSAVSIMKELIGSGNPLFGRISCSLYVEPFDYKQASAFYPSASIRDKITYYTVFGGYPFALSEIDESESVKENIARILFSRRSVVLETVRNVIIPQSERSSVSAEVLGILSNRKLRFSEIQDKMSPDSRASLDRNLKVLSELGLVSKKEPINRKGNARKKTFYEISDNLLRFYFTFVSGSNSSVIKFGPMAYLDSIWSKIETFISYRFEGICKEYLCRKPREEEREVGSYWYDDSISHKNGEFDIAVLLRDETYRIYEAKYLKEPMSEELCNKELSQIAAIGGLMVTSVGFFSFSGFSFPVENRREIYITGKDLFS